MGFSVSGATAILLAASLIAFGMWHSAATDRFERVNDAEQFRADDALAEENTDIEIITATETFAGTRVSVEVQNTGAGALSLNRTDLFFDNSYETGWQGEVVFTDTDGPRTTDLWLPGETLNITRQKTPTRVKLVTENGVSDTAVVN
jgi:flagellar protein FlaF